VIPIDIIREWHKKMVDEEQNPHNIQNLNTQIPTKNTQNGVMNQNMPNPNQITARKKHKHRPKKTAEQKATFLVLKEEAKELLKTRSVVQVWKALSKVIVPQTLRLWKIDVMKQLGQNKIKNNIKEQKIKGENSTDGNEEENYDDDIKKLAIELLKENTVEKVYKIFKGKVNKFRLMYWKLELEKTS